MNKYDRLFELIRKEEVVLFVGAGFSIKAGYPSGNELSQLIYSQLTDSEKANISQSLSLVDLTEEFVQLRGNSRNSLISILKSIYGKNPVDLSGHEKIKSVPHLKNIITTNYDATFENVYSDNCNLISQDTHCSYIDRSRTSIFKIHGDLSVPDSIVITKSDYRHLYSTGNNTVLWTKIKDLLASNSVLFVGYSFEDDNIISIIEFINNALGINRKEMFLIAPDWKEHKIQKLSSFGVKYFSDTANNFLYQLIDNIKIHIKEDFDNKRVTSETFTQFCENYAISPIISLSKNENKVVGIKSTNNLPIENKLTFTVTEDIAEKINSNEFVDSNLPIKIKGVDISSYPSITIPIEKLDNYEYRVNDIVFSTNKNIQKLHIVKLPNLKGELIVKTPNNEMYANIDFKLFLNNKAGTTFGKLIANTLLYTITVEFEKESSSNKTQVKWDTKFNDTIRNTITAIYWTNLLKKIYNGGMFTFYLDSHEFSFNIPHVETKDLILIDLERHTEYYNNISEIEKLLKLKFPIINKFTEENYERSKIVLHYLKKEFELIPAKNYKTSFEFAGNDDIIKMNNENPDGKFVFFQTEEIKEPLILNNKLFNVKIRNIIYPECRIISISVKDNGNYFAELENLSDFIQISYSENGIRQEGLEMHFFD